MTETPEAAPNKATKRKHSLDAAVDAMNRAFMNELEALTALGRKTAALSGLEPHDFGMLLLVARSGGTVSPAWRARCEPRFVDLMARRGLLSPGARGLALTPRGRLLVRGAIERHHVRTAAEKGRKRVIAAGVQHLQERVDHMVARHEERRVKRVQEREHDHGHDHGHHG